MNNRVY